MSHYCRAAMHYVSEEGFATHEVDILDGRAIPDLSWQANGFELLRHTSSVEDWTDIEDRGFPYEEIGALATELTGCDAVLYYPVLVRNETNALRSPDLAPIQIVHSDYTEAYRGMLEDDGHPYRAILRPFMDQANIDGDDIRAARRILTLQFWRNIGPPDMRHPLAFIDARTVAREELQPLLVAEYGGVRTEFESFGVSAPVNPAAHRWVTFPRMSAAELVVFRAYDSDRAARGEPFWTPHSAFADPTLGADAPARESAEMRAICLFL